MSLPSNYQQLLGSWQPVVPKPYLQPLVVPSAERYWYSTGIMMNGTIPYNMCMVPYWISPRNNWSIHKPLVAPVYNPHSTDVYSGKSPSKGIYTGVR